MKNLLDEGFAIEGSMLEFGRQKQVRVIFSSNHLEILSPNLLDKSEEQTLVTSQSLQEYQYHQFVGVSYKNTSPTCLNIVLYMEKDELCLQIPQNEAKQIQEYLRVRVPGLNFFQKYKILETIRTGGQGKVVKCLNYNNNHIYVAKIMRKHEIFTESEVENLKKLTKNPHQNVLCMHEYFQDQHYTIIIFPYVNGGTIYQYMGAMKDKRKVINVKKIMKQILTGLNHIHSLGIIHRDIKMDNIMVEYDDQESSETIKIIDFGFSVQQQNQCDVIKECCGTIGYLAPEIANEEDYDEKCDIFSLSQVFHILLTENPMYVRKLENRKIIQLTKNLQFKIDKKKITCSKTIDLLENMIKEKCQRFSVKQCLSHNFFSKQSLSEKVDGMHNLLFKSPFNNVK